MEQKKNSLFFLKIDAPSGFDVHAIDKPFLEGQFELGESSCKFKLNNHSGIDSISIECKKDDAARRLAPLLTMFAKERVPVAVSGKYLTPSLYGVTSIEITEPIFKIKCSQTFIDNALCYLQGSQQVDEVVLPSKNTPLRPMKSIDEIEKFFKVCRDVLPVWLVEAIQKELEYIRTSVSTPDNINHAKNALQYLVNINWSHKKVAVPDAKTVRSILDEELYGMEEVKTRIEEICAQIRRTGTFPEWGLLLNGPAGTGKTAIAKAFAKIVNLPVIKMDVSSLCNAADSLAGSSRVFSNSRPGRVIEDLFYHRSSTAVMLINEIDKTTTVPGKDGKASSADILLTLLDNQGFYDNYLEVAFPTDMLFPIATCNDLEKVSAPIRDRFLVINIPDYSSEEKATIWDDYVFPKVLRRNNITRSQLDLTEAAKQELITDYATEPGVRDLEQYAEKITGAYLREAEEHDMSLIRIYDADDIHRLLGVRKRLSRMLAANCGEVNSAFYYEGIARMFLIEASVVPGSGNCQILGSLTDVQKDYIRVAIEHAKKSLGVDFTDKDISIFVTQPVPPGADNYFGCATYAAVCGAAMGTRFAVGDTAFIGGVDLHGNLYFDEYDVMPLLKAAKRHNITTLYCPVGVSEKLADLAYYKNLPNVTIIEAVNAESLVALAVQNSNVS